VTIRHIVLHADISTTRETVQVSPNAAAAVAPAIRTQDILCVRTWVLNQRAPITTSTTTVCAMSTPRLNDARAVTRWDAAMNSDTEPMVFGHADGLHQAILNVGSNACQHTEPQAGVQFEVTTTPTSAVINVIDHGPGIDPTEIDRIFLPFYRHQTSRGRDGRGGAGLGLAITNQIIERLEGTVSVTATPGGGVTFTLTVPLAPG